MIGRVTASPVLRRSVASLCSAGLLLTVVAIAANAIAAPADLRVVVNFLIVTGLVLGIQIFSGNSGIVSFGHLAFMGIGAYVGALLTIPPSLKQSMLPTLPGFLADAQVGLLPAVVLAAIAAGLVAAVIGFAINRMEESALSMATFGVLVIFFVIFDNWAAVTRGATGLFGVPKQTGVFSALGYTLVALVVARAFRESRAGFLLRASAADPVAAEALGADVVRLRWIAWTLAGLVLGMMGAVWASFNLAFGPKQFFFDPTFAILAMLVVGGMASTSGAIAGAAVITLVSEIVRRTVDVQGLGPIIIALLILLALYRRPEGLLGGHEIDGVLRRRAARTPEVTHEPQQA